ncbi:MAG: 4-demethylwyosine synthase TYW1, partial [Candidatus Korarchaeota archaeon]|nr:4-demethylwyosine synthase TYW1 [Candidatus Korarchaeota archaeon]NIU82140.1 4-demethylwyosine synthase TYW1 [Candidatus Thorarchaeota archaeon]NIW12583.1 4-demethylwyosine synthase TYW1 [Candidatus Thorarchaeota archaeon]NIW50798.1 4-demethylwyosine synthase TYW1 [Candidatus Korarchaeota archaeon]
HLATSLTGEPLMYPYIGELMEIAKHRDMTTFIVSNGTFPERIERMGTLPTQFYLTLAGPDYRTWAQATNPLWNPRKQWEQLNESLELLPTLNTRTVVRITAIKNMNMRSPSKYARLIEKAEPNFISVKGYSHIGGARKRLNEENQPNMKQVEHFAGELSNETGWKIEEKVERGRAVLLWDEQRERMIEERKYPSAKR